MQSANEILQDATISHQIDELTYSNSVVRKMISLLNKADIDIVAQLSIQLDKMTPSTFNIERLDQLLKSVQRLNKESYAVVSKELNNELKEFVAYETDYEQKLLTSVSSINVATVSASQVYAGAMARPFQGKLLKDWLKTLEYGKAVLIRDAIRIGYIESETTSQIIKRVRGTKALNYKDGILEISRRNAESVILTAIAHTSSFAQERVFEANADIVAGLEYTSVLDTRTTEICASRDGNFYPLDKPRPAIPAHFRCRSRYTVRLKSFREMGLDADNFSASTRASLDGQIPSSTTYQKWLERQSVARQNEVLGVTKAKLFRDGNLPLSRFVSRSGHSYTLEQLKLRDAEAFKRAGL